MVIRERVDIDPTPPLAQHAASSLSDADYPCGEIVGEIIYSEGFESTWAGGGPLRAALEIETSCQSASAALEDHFVLSRISEFGYNGGPLYRYVMPDTADPFIRVPIRSLERFERQTITAVGITRNLTDSGYFAGVIGCPIGGACNKSSLDGIQTSVRRRITGGAQTARPLQPAWPDTMRCGTVAPIPAVAMRYDGAEGWLRPDAPVTYSFAFETNYDPEARASFRGGTPASDEPGASVTMPYGDVRLGRIELEAPACAAVRESRLIHIRGAFSGAFQFPSLATVTVLPPPPARFEVTASADTLDYGEQAYVTSVAVDADGAEVDLPDETPVALAAAPGGFGRYAPRDQSAGGAVTVPYRVPNGYATAYARGQVPFVAQLRDSTGSWREPVPADSALRPLYDAPLTLRASGGGLTGATRLVMRGLDGAGPDSLAVDLGAPEIDCGDSTRVLVRGLLGDESRPLPDSTTVRLVVKDSTVAQLSWLADGVRQSGAQLAVPVGALRDSTAAGVWVTTQECDDQPGFVSVRVCAEVEGYWTGGETITGEGGTIIAVGTDEDGDDDEDEEQRVEVRLLRQDDSVVAPGSSGGYLMVSKVRPDWLLPQGSREPFQTRFGQRRFQNDHAGASSPRYESAYDPHTYRIEVVGLVDSLATSEGVEQLRFLFEVVRDGNVVYRNDPPDLSAVQVSGEPEQTPPESANVLADAPQTGSVRAGAVAGTTNGLGAARAATYVRLVSNGPTGPGVVGRYRYDDEVAGDQTIRVQLLDHVRVTAFALRAGGGGVDTLGQASYPVGAPPSESGIDAVRFGKLAWHTYSGGRTIASEPAPVTNRVSEDWAQASVLFSHVVEPDFDPATAPNILRIEFAGDTLATSAGGVTVTLSTLTGPCTSTAPYVAGRNLRITAAQIVGKVSVDCLGSGDNSGAYARDAGAGESGVEEAYLVFGRASDVTVVDFVFTGDIRVAKDPPDFSTTPRRSEDVLAAGFGYRDADPTTIDVFAVPLRQIVAAASPLTQAFALGEGGNLGNVLFARPEATDLRDDYPNIVGHEVGHVLLVGTFPGDTPSTPGKHSGQPYHLMYHDAGTGGGEESPDAPKRLTPDQHLAARCESGPASDVNASECPPTDPLDVSPSPLLTSFPR